MPIRALPPHSYRTKQHQHTNNDRSSSSSLVTVSPTETTRTTSSHRSQSTSSANNSPLTPSSPLHLRDKSTLVMLRKSLTRMMSTGSSSPTTHRSCADAVTLNNKGIDYMEGQQYAQARESFRRACKMMEQQRDIHHRTGSEIAAISKQCIISRRSPIPREQQAERVNSCSSQNHGTNNIPQHWDAVSSPCPLEMARMARASKKTVERRTPMEYDEGMDYYHKPIRLSEDGMTNNNAEATIWFNQGRLAHTQCHYDDALDKYIEALQVLKKKSNNQEMEVHASEVLRITTSRLTVAILFGVGHIQHLRKDSIHALRTYMTALTLTKANGEENSLEMAACLNCIGVLHHVIPSGDNQVALEAFQDSLWTRQKCHEQTTPDHHMDIATTWNNMGRCFFDERRFPEALEAYKEALRIRQMYQGGESVDVAATLFNMGQVYQKQKRYNNAKALRCYNQFLRLAKRHFGDYHRDVCVVTAYIGEIFHQEKEYKKALQSFRNSLRVGRVTMGPNHPEIAVILNKIGNLCFETGNLESALKVYHKGLKVEMVALDLANPNIHVTYTNIAEIHKQRKDFDQALRYYRKVLVIQRESKCSDNDIASTLTNIGYMCHKMGDFEQGLAVNQECLRLKRETLGDSHAEVAATLVHVAIGLFQLGKLDLSLAGLSEAYRIRKTLPDCSPRELAFNLYSIAQIFHNQGNNEQALKVYLETARVEKQAMGSHHPDLTMTLYNIAQLYFQSGALDLSVHTFRRSLDIERTCFGDDHPKCARTLNEIGNIELQRGNVKEVMQCFTEAMRIYRRNAMSFDRLVIYGIDLLHFDEVQPDAAAMA